MTNATRKLMTGLFLICTLGTPALADTAKLVSGGAVSMPAPQTPAEPGPLRPVDCSKSPATPLCRPAPPSDIYPHRHPRVVIINQAPTQPPIEIDSLSDDWAGCRKAKLGTMQARDAGDIDQANRLDEWLWKNCRTYSSELRQLEQNAM